MPPVPVPPTSEINDIPAFKPGWWNGRHYDAAFVRELHKNYLKYSTGPGKEFDPWCNINHDDTLAHGRIKSARLDESAPDGPVWYLSATDVPTEIAQLWNARKLQQPSVTFAVPRPSPNGGPAEGYYDKTGKLVNGPVLQSLAFLGNEMPGVKGLGPMPLATFAARVFTQTIRARFRGRLSTFSASQSMQTRDEMIAALAALGMDTNSITPEVPDAFLAATLALCQQAASQPVADTNPAVPGVQMADAMLPPQQTQPNAAPGQTQTQMAAGASTLPNGTPPPTSMLLKFNQDFAGLQTLVAQQGATLAKIRAESLAFERHQSEKMKSIKAEAIRKFCDEMGSTGQMAPAAIPAYTALLTKCDYVAVRKFASGKETGTELDEQMATLRATLPRTKLIGSGHGRVTQPGVTHPESGSGGGVDPNRVSRMLAHAIPNVPALAAAVAARTKALPAHTN